MPIKLNLKNKIIIPIFIIIAMAIMITGGIIYYMIKVNFLKENINYLDVLVKLKTNEITNFVDFNKSHLIDEFDSEEFKLNLKKIFELRNNIDSETYKTSFSYLNNIFSDYSHHMNVLTINLVDEKDTVYYSFEHGEKDTVYYSFEHGENITDYKNKTVKDIFGIEIKNNNIKNNNFFIDIIESKEIQHGEGIPENIMIMSMPIYLGDDYLGMILVEFDIKFIEQVLLNKIGLGETGESYIVSDDKFLNSEIKSIDNSIKKLEIYSSDIINLCLKEKNDISLEGYNNYKNKTVIGVAKYLPEIKGCLITEIEKNEIMKVINNIILWYLLSGIMVFIPTYFFIRLFVQRITTPILDLEESIKKIEKGNLKIDIKIVESGDEFEHLTRAFKNMLVKVRETDKTIRQQVLKQTKIVIKHLEETDRLNLELRKFKQSVDNAFDYITILDWDKNVLYINKAFEKDLGYNLNDLTDNKDYSTYRQLEGKENLNKLWNELYKNKKSTIREFKLRKKDGSELISEAHITPILNESGSNIIFYLFVEHDITKIKEVEEMKNQFLSIASHELRTPMTVIKGYSALLLEEKLGTINSKQKSFLNKIKNNTSNLIHIVNDMLDIGKLESDKMEIIYEEFNLNEFINDIVESFNPMFKEKNVELVGKAPNIIIKSDKQKLNQIITNLLGNAIKFTTKSGKVELTVEKVDNQLKFSVKDNGIGIEKEDLNKLFKKFSQIESTLQREVEGTGLGLVISKLIVEKLGGTIGVESKKGKGTDFFFYIPINNDK